MRKGPYISEKYELVHLLQNLMIKCYSNFRSVVKYDLIYLFVGEFSIPFYQYLLKLFKQ